MHDDAPAAAQSLTREADQSALAELERLHLLQNTIEEAHGCRSLHLGNTRVTVMAREKVAWAGDVETFMLSNQRRCYGWIEEDHGTLRLTFILEDNQVTGPQIAVEHIRALSTARGKERLRRGPLS